MADDFTVMVSDQLKSRPDTFARSTLVGMEGREIVLPERFVPDGELVRWHRENVFCFDKG